MLETRDVFVGPGALFEMPGYFRISLTANDEMVERSLAGFEAALAEAQVLGATAVDLRTDSELVARQISGRYRVKHPDLKPIHARVMDMLRSFSTYTVGHVPRERNLDADRLSNVAIDQVGGGHP